LASLAREADTTLGKLLTDLASRGHALLALLLSCLFLVPAIIPGLSILVGFVILTAGIRMAMGLPVWLPGRLMRRPIRGERLIYMLVKIERFLRKLEGVIRPRGRFLARNPYAARLNGLAMAFGGFLLLLPLPPGTNPPPAFGVALLSIGILEQDGLFVVAGYAVLAAVGSLFALLGSLGAEGLGNFLRACL
jgi:hypothetical protein